MRSGIGRQGRAGEEVKKTSEVLAKKQKSGSTRRHKEGEKPRRSR